MSLSKYFRSIRQLILFTKRKTNPKQFLLIMCIVVSALSALAAVLLKWMVFHIEQAFFDENPYSVILGFKSITPVIGIGVSTFLILKVYKKNFVKGNDMIIYSMIKKHSNLPFSAMYSPLVTSSITVGLGGSAGLESPLVASGSAIGSNMGRIAFLSQKDKTLLIGCGAAAAISTAFSAPIAGVLFALEVLIIDLSLAALIPLLLAAIIGTLLSTILLGNEVLLSFDNLQPFDYSRLPYYVIIGIVSGLLSVFYTKIFTWMEHKFATIHSATGKWLYGSLLLGVLIFMFPPLFGDGYLFIKSITKNDRIVELPFYMSSVRNGWLLLVFTCLLLLFKVFATGFTVLGGGNGGSFAPSLFIGALVGFIVAKISELAFGQTGLPVANFIVAGMAGVLSGILYAPLTAIFLSAELTNGYPLFVPLMIVSAISYLFAKSFFPLSMELQKVQHKSMLHNFNRDHFLLSTMNLDSFVDAHYPSFNENMSVAKVSEKIKETTKLSYAILDKENRYVGILTLNDLKNVLMAMDNDWKESSVKDIMQKQEPLVINQSLATVLERFNNSERNEFPVVDEQGKWLGFVQEKHILELYRKEINMSVLSEL
ncbi:MAG: chloride channel protein [Chitinophagaceae bacterium]